MKKLRAFLGWLLVVPCILIYTGSAQAIPTATLES